MFTASLLTALFAMRQAAPAEPSVAGRWKVIVKHEDETRDYFLELKQDGTKVAGTLISPRSGEYPFEGGSFQGGKLKIAVPRKFGDDVVRTFTVEAEAKEPGRLVGVLRIDEFEAGDVTLTPVAQPAGKWSVLSKSPDGQQEYPYTLEISQEGEALKGKIAGPLGEFKLDAVQLKDDKLVFELTLPLNGNNVTFVVTAAFHAPGSLVGRWKARDAEITGDWSATRAGAAPAPAAPAAAAPAVAAAAAAPAAEIAAWKGKWFGVSSTAEGRKQGFELEFEPKEGSISGEIRFRRGTAKLQNGKIEGKKIQFSFDLPGGEAVQVKIEGELHDGEVLRGAWTAASGATGEWLARKPMAL